MTPPADRDYKVPPDEEGPTSTLAHWRHRCIHTVSEFPGTRKCCVFDAEDDRDRNDRDDRDERDSRDDRDDRRDDRREPEEDDDSLDFDWKVCCSRGRLQPHAAWELPVSIGAAHLASS